MAGGQTDDVGSLEELGLQQRRPVKVRLLPPWRSGFRGLLLCWDREPQLGAWEQEGLGVVGSRSFCGWEVWNVLLRLDW